MNENEVSDDDLQLFVSRRGNKWSTIACLFDLTAELTQAFARFFDKLGTLSMQRFLWEDDRQKFFQEASRDIESLASIQED